MRRAVRECRLERRGRAEDGCPKCSHAIACAQRAAASTRIHFEHATAAPIAFEQGCVCAWRLQKCVAQLELLPLAFLQLLRLRLQLDVQGLPPGEENSGAAGHARGCHR